MSRRTLLFILASVLLLSAETICQQATTLDYVKLIDAVNFYSKSSVFVQTPQGGGTGTLFSVPFSDTAQAGLTYLATAKHVLDKRDSTGKIIGRYDTVSVLLNLKRGLKESRKYRWQLLSNDLDIAVLYSIESRRSFSVYDVVAPELAMIATFAELKKGQFAFLSGYPYAVGTQGPTLDPVIQSGMVALVDTLHSLVLVDIPVNHGNSGCPVFVVTNSTEVKLLGLVFEYQPSSQDYVFSRAENAMVPANTSLGRVVTINSLLSELRKLPH
jgi:hypothetical protein